MEVVIEIEIETEIKVAFCMRAVQKEKAGDLPISDESSTLSSAGPGLPRNGCDLPQLCPAPLFRASSPNGGQEEIAGNERRQLATRVAVGGCPPNSETIDQSCRKSISRRMI
jgi:hypothetical protein